MVCGTFVAYEKTGLAEAEAELRENHPAAATYGVGWTRNVTKQWACQDCLNSARALKAYPLEQNFMGYSGPVFAFADQTRTCQHCAEDFTFTASEQKFWYEERKFHPKAVPLHCRECRRKVRRVKVANRKLGEALQVLDGKNWEQLARIGELYSEIGAWEQSKLYFRRAKNQCREPEELSIVEQRARLFSKRKS